MLQCCRRTGNLPSFFVPTPGDLIAQESPPPGICHPRPKNANVRGSAWGGGERGAGRRWNWLIHKMNNNFTRLEDAIYYILRTLFRTKDESFESLLNLVGMDTLKHRRYYQALMLIYKCLYSIGPKYIADSWNKGCML